MDPITAITAGSAAVGLISSIMGGSDKYAAAKQTAAAQSQIAGLETQQDAVRKQAMEVGARRQQMEVLRNQQRARSLALNNATSQGAQFGSGLQGGYGQIAGQTGVNMLGISQGLQSGQQMFGLNAQINTQKQMIAQASAMSAQGQGESALGAGILGNLGTIKNLSGGISGPASAGGGMSSYGGWMSSMGTGGLI